MAFLAGGLLASLGLYLGAIYGINWSESRRIANATGQDVPVDRKAGLPPPREIWKRHSLEWLFGYLILFVLLTIVGFTLGERMGLCVALALVFGSVWFDQSGRNSDPEVRRGRRSVDNLWYWLLATADWLGFLLVLCFASGLLVEAF